MKEIYFYLILIAGLAMSCEKPAPKKAVFIIVDGIPADVIEKVSTPALDNISKAGGYTRAYVGGEPGEYNETPTISAPGYMSLITATWAHKHNVWGNDSLSPNYHYWNVFRTVETVKPELTTAVFSTWLDNRTILIGEGNPEAGDFRIDYAFDGFEKDTVRFPHNNGSDYILAIDELVSTEAAQYIATHAPDLSWVYLEYTDDMGHSFGDSEQFYDAIKTADTQIEKIWEAVKKRQAMGEDWMIVVTTDHGRDATGHDHGGQSDRERTTWITTNSQNLNKKFQQTEPAIMDIGVSLLRHLGITPPQEVADEMDGIPFTGDISFHTLRAKLDENHLLVNWAVVNERGDAEVRLAFTNHFAAGGEDEYITATTVPVKAGNAALTLTEDQLKKYHESGIIKVVLRAPMNVGNRWITIAEAE
ncbi:MAG: alkaline phosphatase family protein [Bacteroidia bacterium]